ncbi:hypothetical protein BOQ62_18775 [Chryseobacterium sp. CH21]|nr:hypothetical protein BOQ62_18775 [Chryseobacterium sp. CH21]
MEFGVGELMNKMVNSQLSIRYACEFILDFGMRGSGVKFRVGIHHSLCEAKIDLLTVLLLPLDFNLQKALPLQKIKI